VRKKLLSAFLLLGSLLGLAQAQVHSNKLQMEQHQAVFTIVMSNEKKDKKAGCTATAISEHVLLTAAHCDIEDGVLYLNQDHSPYNNPQIITEKFYDHQDHLLLVVPGVSFKHFAKYDPSVYKPLTQGEHYYLYGSPGLLMDQFREGYTTGKVMINAGEDKQDDDIDVHSPFLMLSGPVIGGDSGSSIYAEDGRIVGVLTYGIYNGMFAGMFPLAFTSEQVAQAEGHGNFVYLKVATSTEVKVEIKNTGLTNKNNTTDLRALEVMAAILLAFYIVPKMLSALYIVLLYIHNFIVGVVRWLKRAYAALKKA
jgi:hypothetical protein